MKALLIIFSVFLHQAAYSFTLSESNGRSFNNNDINIYISPTSCDGAGFNTSELKSMVENAVDDYWNAVPTSSLKLHVKNIDPAMDIDGMDHDTAITNIVPIGSIVAGCNDDVTEFSNASILGAAVIDCKSSDCKAVLILNANNSNLNNKSSREIEAVIAHELGHAIGLGHTEVQHNLMYYSTGGKTQKWLGQDDVDGVSYLYPHPPELSCLLGSLGTISLNKDDSGPNKFLLNFGFALFISFILAGFLRRKLSINY